MSGSTRSAATTLDGTPKMRLSGGGIPIRGRS
jgi:hypothetical protein